MTPQEMILEVQLGLQKVNANFYDEFEPEEIDAALNKMQLRFINNRFLQISDSLGLEQIQKRMDDIRGVVERDSPLTVLRRDDTSQYAILPADYLYLINDVSQTEWHCDGIEATTASTTRYIAKAEIKDSETSTTAYKNLVFTVNGVPAFTLSDYAPQGFGSIEEKYRVIDLFLEVMAEKYRAGEITYQVYFEKYLDQYEANHFFFVSFDATLDALNVVFTEDSVIDTGTFAGTALSTETTTKEKTTTKWVSNRLIENEKLFWVLDHPFGKTSNRSPLSSIDERRLLVFRDQTFILKGLTITYIRKPRKISLALNRSCELADHTHPEIVNMTVSHLLERVEAARYQTSKIEEKLDE